MFPDFLVFPCTPYSIDTGYWKVTGRVDFKIFISDFWPLGEGFRGFRPQIRLQHAKISILTSFEVIWLELRGFPKFGPVAFQYPVKGPPPDFWPDFWPGFCPVF